jgi:hypothetical protein
MKAILEFNLGQHDNLLYEQRAYLRCAKATDLACALFEISRNLKKKLEYMTDKMDGPGASVVIFDQIASELEKHNINLDELLD